MSVENEQRPLTIPDLRSQKGKTQITMLTAYDYPTARILDEAGIDALLVGDSLGCVVYGEPNTLSVTMDQMLMHTRAVSRGAKRAVVIGDMPFLSYQVSKEDAVRNAGRFIQEAGAHAVKLEGGLEMADRIAAIVRTGIPVCGHIGLTPQSVNAVGRFRTFGKTEDEVRYLVDSAKAVEAAGAFALVLECVTDELAAEITKSLSIPTIGIGAGERCDGQVLVFHDLVGLTLGKVPRFVKARANIKETIREAAIAYRDDVRSHQASSKGGENVARN